MTQHILTAVLMAFPALVILGGVRDLVSYRIPNWISLALLAAFVPAAVLGWAAGVPLDVLGLHLAVGAAALVAGVVMWTLRWIGGGDAKLFAAAVLWLGWPAAGPFMLVTALAGGALTLGLLSLRSGWFEPVLAGSPPWIRKLGARGGDIPYGVAIAVGALMAFPQGALTLAVGA